ncbi:MAG: hypothetical protein IPK20_19710 [Betaproteobacteria bacterium]|nr:hypothetical protein [Betaproteobacteria bacterium]
MSQKPPQRSEPPRPTPPQSPPSWLERLGWITFDPDDSADERLRKSMLLFTAALTNVAAAVWLAIYWAFGVRLPATLPLGYQVASRRCSSISSDRAISVSTGRSSWDSS